jgi:hypothetical protein
MSIMAAGVWRDVGAELADAEAVVEQRPDDELFGGGLASVGSAVGLLYGHGLADARVGHCSRGPCA